MMQKRSLWAVLAAVLLMVLVTNGVMADEKVFRSGDYQYCILEDGTAEITKYSGRDRVLKIPNTLDGKTVTSIGKFAFAWSSSLTGIELPDSVTSIGDRAFNSCSASSIELPDSVTSMGVNPFADCRSLKNIQVSPEQPVFAVIDGVLFNKAEKSLICYPAGKQEEAYEVPQGIQQIKSVAFEGCSSLTTIKLPDSVTSIGNVAFSKCSSLTSIELPDSVTSIGKYAFYGCSALTSIELPDSVTSMGSNPFKGCGRLKNIQVSPKQPVFAVIDGVLFNKEEKSLICYPAGKQEEAYEVPQGIQQIKSVAFEGCSSLTTIKLPDSVTSIEDEAFYGCSALTSIELPDSVTSIGKYAFYGCSALTSIELPDSVTSIGESAFSGCSTLTGIELPDSVTSIGDRAFEGCSNLTITVQRDSYAARYAKDNNLNYTYPDTNDWLNN